jgi:hypothetical protein
MLRRMSGFTGTSQSKARLFNIAHRIEIAPPRVTLGAHLGGLAGEHVLGGDSGCAVSYGTNLSDVWRVGGTYVARSQGGKGS